MQYNKYFNHVPRSIENLRSHVLHCSTKCETQLLVRALFDTTKICQLYMTLSAMFIKLICEITLEHFPPVQHNILRFKIPVDDS